MKLCNKLRQFLQNHQIAHHVIVSNSRDSISNPSYQSKLDEEEEVEELSPSELFTWSRMQNIYMEYRATVTDQDDLTPEVVAHVKAVFEFLLTDENKYAERIYDSVLDLDSSYSERFFTYSNLSSKFRPREHMIRQIKKIMEFHRIVLEAFIDDRNEALEIINLLALSHVLMKVYIVDFRLFDLAIGKFLLRYELMDDSNSQSVVAYMNTVTNYVEYFMQQHTFENRKIALMLTDSDKFMLDEPTEGERFNSISRDNYRKMKQWQMIQLLLRRAVQEREDHEKEKMKGSPLAGTSSAGSKSKMDLDGGDADRGDMSETRLIQWLKRGYKYRKNQAKLASKAQFRDN